MLLRVNCLKRVLLMLGQCAVAISTIVERNPYHNTVRSYGERIVSKLEQKGSEVLTVSIQPATASVAGSSDSNSGKGYVSVALLTVIGAGLLNIVIGDVGKRGDPDRDPSSESEDEQLEGESNEEYMKRRDLYHRRENESEAEFRKRTANARFTEKRMFDGRRRRQEESDDD